MTTTTERVTLAQAREAVDTYLAGKYLAPAVPYKAQNTTLNTIALGLTNVQVRDYLLGVSVDFPHYTPDFMGSALSALLHKDIIVNGAPEVRAGIYSVMSAYAYESGDTDKAFDLLLCANNLVSGYSLAMLLSRVYSTGWPIEAFKAMRTELHPAICEALDGTLVPE